MATAEESAAAQVKPKKSKSRSERRAKASRSGGRTEKLKIVVRRLPPNLPEEVFWQSVQPWVTSETASWKTFYPGKVRKSYNKDNTPARAYICFKTAEQLAAFSSSYDGHIFRDKAGNESVAVVEFAPCQKVPAEKKKADPRIGTIEEDEDFISFLESLKAPPTKPSDSDALESLIASTQTAPEPKSTPLLDALKAEKLAQRDKESILKNHAHYRRGELLDGRDKGKGIATGRSAAEGSTGRKSRRGGKKGEDAKDGAAALSNKGGYAPGPSGQGKGTSSKPPRAPRERGAPSSSAGAGANTGGTAEGAEGGKDTTKERERRTRPAMGFGISTRQFEAALTGAGVVPVGGAERKSRRERKEERREAGGADSGAGVPAKSEGEDSKSSAPAPSARSPRGGGRRRGDGAKSPSLGPQRTRSDAPPMILSRIDDAPPPTPMPAKLPRADMPPSMTSGDPLDSSSRGRGRGGRGGRRGGRGRGGPPAMGRGSADT